MSVHESYTLAFQCMEALSVVIKKDAELTRCISLKDIIEVFLNYGTIFD